MNTGKDNIFEKKIGDRPYTVFGLVIDDDFIFKIRNNIVNYEYFSREDFMDDFRNFFFNQFNSDGFT